MNRIPRPALAAAPFAVVLTLAMTVGAAAQVASLASPDESPDPETTEAVVEFEDRGEAMLEFAQCLRDNGIDVDDPQDGAGGMRAIIGSGPGSDGPTVDRRSEEFMAASDACSMYLEAARPEIDPEAEQERLEEQLALAQCIRDNGYPEYPDPAIGADGRLERAGGRDMQTIGIDRRSPDFQEVIGACRDGLGLEQGRFGLGGPGAGDGGN